MDVLQLEPDGRQDVLVIVLREPREGLEGRMVAKAVHHPPLVHWGDKLPTVLSLVVVTCTACATKPTGVVHFVALESPPAVVHV